MRKPSCSRPSKRILKSRIVNSILCLIIDIPAGCRYCSFTRVQFSVDLRFHTSPIVVWNKVDRRLARRATPSSALGGSGGLSTEPWLELSTGCSGRRDGESSLPFSGVPNRARRREEIFSIAPPSVPP
jgi:hypothetical protein